MMSFANKFNKIERTNQINGVNLPKNGIKSWIHKGTNIFNFTDISLQSTHEVVYI